MESKRYRRIIRKIAGLVFAGMLLLIGFINGFYVSGAEEPDNEQDYIYRVLYGTFWSHDPTDEEISAAVDSYEKYRVDYSENQYDKSTTTVEVKFGDPIKAHVILLKNRPQMANTVIIPFVSTWIEEVTNIRTGTVLKYEGQNEGYLKIEQNEDSTFSFSDEAQMYDDDGDPVYAEGWLYYEVEEVPEEMEDIVSEDREVTPEEEAFPWELVIGGAALVAAVATALSRAAKKGKASKDNKPVGYILQLSENKLQTSPKNPSTLKITAYRVSKSGAYTPAPEVILQITPQKDSRLKISPNKGKKEMTAEISVADTRGRSSETLTITGNTVRTSVTTTVVVEFLQTYKIEFF